MLLSLSWQCEKCARLVLNSPKGKKTHTENITRVIFPSDQYVSLHCWVGIFRLSAQWNKHCEIKWPTCFDMNKSREFQPLWRNKAKKIWLPKQQSNTSTQFSRRTRSPKVYNSVFWICLWLWFFNLDCVTHFVEML